MDRVITSEVYKFIFENSFDAIFLTHPNGTIFRANPAACEMLQRTEEEICQIGRAGVIDLNDPRIPITIEERLRRGKVRAEMNYVKRNGTIFPTEVTSTIFLDAIGQLWTISIVRDMSMFKEAENLLRKAQEESEHFATYDYLTGILNRRAFMDRLNRELHRSKRENSSLSLLLMDMDYFKQINDTYGHTCGDEVLKFAAMCLQEKLRPYDILGRFGGDEFIICLPNTNSTKAYVVAERLRTYIENCHFIYNKVTITSTISIGVVSNENNINADSTYLILNADRNLYSAKIKRNSVCCDESCDIT